MIRLKSILLEIALSGHKTFSINMIDRRYETRGISFFEEYEKLQSDTSEPIGTSPEVEYYRDQWIGGVADFGDPSAAYEITEATGYDKYIEQVRILIKQKIGTRFYVYRLASVESLEDWMSGSDMPPAGYSLSFKLANSFKNFAGHDEHPTQRMVVRIQIEPESVIFIGHPQEEEFVIDQNLTSWSDVEIFEGK